MSDALSSYACLVVVDYPARRVPYALARMAFDPRELERTKCLLFWKLGGTGQGLGFSAWPNWNRYALFTTWMAEGAWWKFFAESPVIKRMKRYGREFWWVTLLPERSRGSWDGRSLFKICENGVWEGPAAVLTRATIRLGRMARFWSEVGPVSAALTYISSSKWSSILCEGSTALNFL